MTFLEIYDELICFRNLEQNEFGKKQESHGFENIQYNEWHCMFCGGSHPKAKFTKKAHAISETIGNNRLFNYLECQACNLHFGKAFEDSLGKYTAPFRFISHIFGKKNTVTIKDMPEPQSEISYMSYRMEITKRTSDTKSTSPFNNLDYLIEQSGRELPRHRARSSPSPLPRPVQRTEKPAFILPIPNQDYRRVFAYLQKRGIASQVILGFIKFGFLRSHERQDRSV